MSAPFRGLVLVVDNEPEQRAVIGDLLTAWGYRVVPADSGAHTFTLLPLVDPDIVLLDVDMPKMNGLEVLRRIVTSWPHIPVVMLTGITDPEVLFALRDAGAADYVAKPLMTSHLPEILSAQVAAARERRTRRA